MSSRTATMSGSILYTVRSAAAVLGGVSLFLALALVLVTGFAAA